jgi:hypothetical protein
MGLDYLGTIPSSAQNIYQIPPTEIQLAPKLDYF